MRNWKMEDAVSIAYYANNLKIPCNLRDGFPHPYTLKTAQEYIGGIIVAGDEKQLCLTIDINGNAVGSIGVFLGGNIYSKSAEIGYWLGEEYWNKGIITNAIKGICKLAHEKYDLARIFAEPFARNTASRSALEKAGFVLEGIMKNGAYKDGQVIDFCMYALT